MITQVLQCCFTIQGTTGKQDHTVVVNNSIFCGLSGYTDDKNMPLAALAVGSQYEGTKLKLFVYNSNFTGNKRAIDVAIKGETVVEIENSLFSDESW